MPRTMASSRLYTHRNDPYDVDHYIQQGDTERMALIRSRRAVEAMMVRFKTAYLLRVEMPTRLGPSITRILRVPENLTFSRLHKAIQIAFDWEDRNLYEFMVYPAGNVHEDTLIYGIQNQEETWNRREPHWTEEGPRDERYMCDKNVRMRRIFGGQELSPHDIEIRYAYDTIFGWDHIITFLGVADEDLDQELLHFGVKEGQRIFCTDGEGAPFSDKQQRIPMYPDPTRRNVGLPNQHDPYYWDPITINRQLDRMWIASKMTAANKRTINREIEDRPDWVAERNDRIRESAERLADNSTELTAAT